MTNNAPLTGAPFSNSGIITFVSDDSGKRSQFKISGNPRRILISWQVLKTLAATKTGDICIFRPYVLRCIESYEAAEIAIFELVSIWDKSLCLT